MTALDAARLALDLIAPLPLALLAITAGLFAGLTRSGAAGLAVAAAGVAALWISSTPVVADLLQRDLESRHGPQRPAELSPADVILVLGGGVEPALPPRLAPDLKDAADRVVESARLWKAGVAPRILVSGGNPTAQAGPTEAEAMRALLGELGVPEEAVIAEAESRNTRENCRMAARVLQRHGWQRAVLVTSALHMPRALGTCRRAGIDAVGASTDLRVVESTDPSWRRLLPDVDALEGTTRALRERLSLLVYDLLDWTGPAVPDERGAGPGPGPPCWSSVSSAQAT